MVLMALISLGILIKGISMYLNYTSLNDEESSNKVFIKEEKQYFLYGIILIALSIILFTIGIYINIIILEALVVTCGLTSLICGSYILMYSKNTSVYVNDDGIEYKNILKTVEFIKWNEVTDIRFNSITRRLIVECYDIKIKLDISNNLTSQFLEFMKKNLNQYFYQDAVDKLQKYRKDIQFT
ncbi:hypothetical protein [Clostridium manihotivorum]|uniref:Uncharacterized protein n=1 Tax=Clostridium manihotivorum TaxID=2320868 RepID=A0A410DQM4_9CLOT|nr:hypothetical protein [Clostridium manihotivorum]QAA31409.1 hypothetical protein C1I91_07005 [Clostridium manihotivorum]